MHRGIAGLSKSLKDWPRPDQVLPDRVGVRQKTKNYCTYSAVQGKLGSATVVKHTIDTYPPSPPPPVSASASAYATVQAVFTVGDQVAPDDPIAPPENSKIN